MPPFLALGLGLPTLQIVYERHSGAVGDGGIEDDDTMILIRLDGGHRLFDGVHGRMFDAVLLEDVHEHGLHAFPVLDYQSLHLEPPGRFPILVKIY